MNEIKFNETMEEIGDFFERRESAIEEAKNNSIENIRSKTENAHGTNLSNLTNQIRAVEERYKKQLQELKNTRSAIFNIQSKFSQLKSRLSQHNKIYELMSEIQSDLLLNGEVNSEINKMIKNYRSEYGAIYSKYFNEFKDVLEKATKTTTQNGYINNRIKNDSFVTLGSTLEDIEKAYDSLFYSSKKSEGKPIDRLVTSTKEKLKIIEKYEEEVKKGHFERITKNVVSSSFFHKNKQSKVEIDTGKKQLLNILKYETRIEHMSEVLRIMKPMQGEYSKTYIILKTQVEKQKQLLQIEKEDFAKTDFKIVESTIESQKNKDLKHDTIQKCAQIQAEIEQLLKEHSNETEEILYLESQFKELAQKANLGENEIDVAQKKGHELYLEKKSSQEIERVEKEFEKWKKDITIGEESKQEEKLREEVIQEMVRQGWKHPGPVIMKGGEIDSVEEAKLWEAEVDRRLNERLKTKAPSHITDNSTQEDVENKTVLDMRQNMDELKQDIKSSIISRLELDSVGVVSDQEKEDKINYYMSTLNKGRQERALDTLKKEGYIPQNATLSNLNPIQQNALEAQMRIEFEISDAIEKFKDAKDEYDKFMLAERQQKLDSLNVNKGKHM